MKFLVVLLLTLGACSHGRYAMPIRNGPITSTEIRAHSGIIDAYEAVSMLRPQWLSQTGMTLEGPVGPCVYVDDQAYREGIRGLRGISAGIVREIKYLDRYDAPFQFGVLRDYPAGVIWVITIYS